MRECGRRLPLGAQQVAVLHLRFGVPGSHRLGERQSRLVELPAAQQTQCQNRRFASCQVWLSGQGSDQQLVFPGIKQRLKLCWRASATVHTPEINICP